MNRTFVTLSLMPLLVCLTPVGHANEFEIACEQRFAQLEAEAAALHNALEHRQQVMASQSTVRNECEPSGLYGGAELVFARPHLKEAFRASTVDLAGTQTLLPYDYDYVSTPRLWLGYVAANRTGIRGRYWDLDEAQGPEELIADGFNFPGTQQVALIFPAVISTDAPGEVLRVSHGIELETAEVEGTLHFRGWGNRFVASAGLAYARISQEYRSTVIAGGIPEQILNWDRNLEGIGPTLGLEARRPLGGCGLEFFGGARFALLFAEKDLQRFTVGGPSVPPFAAVPSLRYEGADELLVTGQVQLGVQWTRHLSWGGELFARGTYEGQIWTDSGGNALGYLGVEGFGLAVGVAR